MKDSNTPIVLVVCNDYGELAFAMYLLDSQSFAQNTVLMLPPRLYASNSDVLPGRTFAYHSLNDVREKLEGQAPGVLGLFSGYLLPIHRLCEPDELDALLRSTTEQGWRLFTSDPFLGLLDDLEPSKLFTLESPKKWPSLLAASAVITSKWASRLLTKMRRALKKDEDPALSRAQTTSLLTQMHNVLTGMLHVYACSDSSTETGRSLGTRLHFHNNAFVPPPNNDASASTPTDAPDSPSWLFVLGDHDYMLQRAKFGRKFLMILTQKLHETLQAGRIPTLIAPTEIVEALREISPVSHAMNLLGYCGYSQFQSLLIDAEYVFYWNAVSFSCILRTLSGKPWFSFDQGHLLGGMQDAYASRIFDWFYRGGKPPYLDIGDGLSSETLQEATEQYEASARRMQQALVDLPNPQALLAVLATTRSPAPESNPLN